MDVTAASYSMTAAQRRVMRDILVCRTAVLGGHLDVCLQCGDKTPSYNSCLNRHCPKCQSLAQARWIAERKTRILPVPHFHVVFTIPSTLRPLANQNRKAVFDLLFSTVSSTLRSFGSDPRWLGGQLGVTAVLHTWTRDLRFHPHLHCIVTAGGLSLDGTRWLAARQPAFLFPVRALGDVFRARMLAGLRAAYDDGTLQCVGTCANLAEPERFGRLLGGAARTRWHVYAKPPFGGAEHVTEYLGRYTHRVGLSNQRLVHHDDGGVRFRTKDGRTTTLPPLEFIRRFLMHVLPAGFVKIRHYGLLAAGNVNTRLQAARALLSSPPSEAAPSESKPSLNVEPESAEALLRDLTGIDLRICPRCNFPGRVRMPLLRPEIPLARGPP